MNPDLLKFSACLLFSRKDILFFFAVRDNAIKLHDSIFTSRELSAVCYFLETFCNRMIFRDALWPNTESTRAFIRARLCICVLQIYYRNLINSHWRRQFLQGSATLALRYVRFLFCARLGSNCCDDALAYQTSDTRRVCIEKFTCAASPSLSFATHFVRDTSRLFFYVLESNCCNDIGALIDNVRVFTCVAWSLLPCLTRCFLRDI